VESASVVLETTRRIIVHLEFFANFHLAFARASRGSSLGIARCRRYYFVHARFRWEAIRWEWDDALVARFLGFSRRIFAMTCCDRCRDSTFCVLWKPSLFFACCVSHGGFPARFSSARFWRTKRAVERVSIIDVCSSEVSPALQSSWIKGAT
jgi:hypothetical protein